MLSPRPIKYVFVGYFRTQKVYRCYSPSNMKYFVSVDVMFFESVPYFFPHSHIPASESILPSPSILLPASAHVPDVFSPVSLKILQSNLHHSMYRISDTFTLIDKKFLPLNQFQPTPFQWKVHLLSHQHLLLILMFLLQSAKVNNLVLIILSLILFSMIVLFFIFASLSCLCPQYLYSSHIRRLYWYLPEIRPWMR